MASEEYGNGTIIFKYSDEPMYGVVIDEDFWIAQAEKEDPQVAKDYLETDQKWKLIPIFILGNVICQQFSNVKEGDVLFESVYLQRFTYSNVGGDIHRIQGGLPEIFNVLMQMIAFYGERSGGYASSVKKDLVFLSRYLYGNLNDGLATDNSARKKWFDFYSKALPGLSGTVKIP